MKRNKLKIKKLKRAVVIAAASVAAAIILFYMSLLIRTYIL